MKLQVGEFYLSAGGEIVKIAAPYNKTLFEDNSGRVYSKNGIYLETSYSDDEDLIAHIPKELHYKICDLINDYHMFPTIKENIDIFYKNKTTIPD